jgi:hypothetical protein
MGSTAELHASTLDRKTNEPIDEVLELAEQLDYTLQHDIQG